MTTALPSSHAAHVAAVPGAVAGQEVAGGPVGGIEQIGVHRHGEHAGAVVDAPGDRRVAPLQRPPEPAGMFDDRHGRAVVLAVVAQQAGRAVLRRGPGRAAIGRAADEDVAVVPVRPEQVERPAMHEQARPERPLDLGELLPGLAAVGGAEDGGAGALEFVRLRPEEVVRRDVVAVGQNGDARRADVEARRGGEWSITTPGTCVAGSAAIATVAHAANAQPNQRVDALMGKPPEGLLHRSSQFAATHYLA